MQMIKGYISIKEVAEKWDITPRRVRVLCETGRIEGLAESTKQCLRAYKKYVGGSSGL